MIRPSQKPLYRRALGALLALLLLVCMPALRPAEAAPVTALSGEHDGFTRIALDFGAPVDWQFGRGLDGYVLRLTEGTATYDLSKVFSRAGNSRLAAIWGDPETGDLNLSMACSCHAMPFEFRPGIVVIDLKDGPPPANSSFETMLAAPVVETVSNATGLGSIQKQPDGATRAKEPAASSYDWTKLALQQAAEMDGPSNSTTEPDPPPPDPTESALPNSLDPALQGLRDQVLLELADGASRGIIQLARPEEDPHSSAGLPEFPSAQIRIDGAPMAILDSTGGNGDLAAKGETCPSADLLAVASWGEAGKPFDQQLAEVRKGLIGEFDKTEPEVLEKTVRFLLFLGFGAEARSYISGFGQDMQDDALYRSLSYLVDDESDPSNYFLPFANCEGPAAFWSVLAGAKPGAINDKAALLAFSDLPVQLRRHLGPRLAQAFLDSDKAEAARAVRDAILRAPEGSSPEVQLLKAEMAARSGDVQSAAEELEALRAEGGAPGNDALVALVELRAASRQPVAPEDAASLQALIDEQEPGAQQDRYRLAFQLALAASGQFDAAFDLMDAQGATEGDLWGLLAKIGDDDALLRHAIPALNGANRPRAEPQDALEIGRRLIALGLPKEGKAWADISGAALPEDQLAAAMALGDGSAALAALADLPQDSSEAAFAARKAALRMANDNDALAEILADDPEARSLALARAGSWEELAKTGETAWQDVAIYVKPQDTGALGQTQQQSGPPANGPTAVADQASQTNSPLPAALRPVTGGLALGKAQVEGAGKTREAILALLSKVGPVASQP